MCSPGNVCEKKEKEMCEKNVMIPYLIESRAVYMHQLDTTAQRERRPRISLEGAEVTTRHTGRAHML